MSSDILVEVVPRLTKRAGDAAFASANNSTILLGRDRIGSVDSGYGSGSNAGAMHLIVGRSKTDPSLIDDSATIYLSMRSDPDLLVQTEKVGKTQRSMSAVLVRADCVRIVPRTDMKISVGNSYLSMVDGSVVIESASISLGNGGADHAVLGDAYRNAESSLNSSVAQALTAIGAALTALGAVPPLAPAAGALGTAASAAASAASAVSSFESAAASYLSAIVKVK